MQEANRSLAVDASFNYLFTFGKDFFTPEESQLWQTHPLLEQGKIADDGVFFAVGQQGTGLPFHFHKEAWNEAVAGMKRWSIYPPQTVPPGVLTSKPCVALEISKSLACTKWR